MLKEDYDFGEAILRPWKLPGGSNFILRVLGSVILIWVVMFAILGPVLVKAYIAMFQQIVELENSGQDPESFGAVMSLLSPILGSYMLMGLLSWAVNASAEAAMHKNTFYDFDGGLFPLRFGIAELRIMGIQFVAGLLIMVGFIFLVIPGIYLGVKLSAASAMSVRDDRFRLFESMDATKGYGWIMLGSFIVIYIIGYVIMNIVMYGGMFAIIGDGSIFSAIESLSGDSTGEEIWSVVKSVLFKPQIFITLIITTLLYSVATILMYFHFWSVGNYAASLDEINMDSIGE